MKLRGRSSTQPLAASSQVRLPGGGVTYQESAALRIQNALYYPAKYLELIDYSVYVSFNAV